MLYFVTRFLLSFILTVDKGLGLFAALCFTSLSFLCQCPLDRSAVMPRQPTQPLPGAPWVPTKEVQKTRRPYRSSRLTFLSQADIHTPSGSFFQASAASVHQSSPQRDLPELP